MKTVPISAAVSIALWGCGSLAAVSLKLAKTSHATSVGKRHILPRQTVFLELLNNITGGSYSAQIMVGTPPQEQSLVVDTGSSDLWVLDNDAGLCVDVDLVTVYGGCSSTFDSSKSSSFTVTAQDGFNITYLDNSRAIGDYITEDISFGNETIKGQLIGLARDVTSTSGIMGIGFTANVASNSQTLSQDAFTYPTVIDQMFEQKVINLKAYSLYLDAKSSDTGSVIFGGMDSDKWIGNLTQLPLVPSELPNGTEVLDHFTIVMESLIINEGSINTSLTSDSFRIPVVLDSGSTLTYLPPAIVKKIYTEVDALDDSTGTGIVFVDCNLESRTDLNLIYEFGSPNSSVSIRVPISELVYQLSEIIREGYVDLLGSLPFVDTCVFGIMPSFGVNILGDTFLRSAYVVYDISNGVVAMAQMNPNSEKENIIDFEAGATAIPRISGVARTGGMDDVQTATGSSTRRPSATGSGTGSGNAPLATTSKPSSAGLRVSRSVDSSMWSVFGVSAAFAMLGAGGFALL